MIETISRNHDHQPTAEQIDRMNSIISDLLDNPSVIMDPNAVRDPYQTATRYETTDDGHKDKINVSRGDAALCVQRAEWKNDEHFLDRNGSSVTTVIEATVRLEDTASDTGKSTIRLGLTVCNGKPFSVSLRDSAQPQGHAIEVNKETIEEALLVLDLVIDELTLDGDV